MPDWVALAIAAALAGIGAGVLILYRRDQRRHQAGSGRRRPRPHRPRRCTACLLAQEFAREGSHHFARWEFEYGLWLHDSGKDT